MMLLRYLIRNPLKELYWIGDTDPAFTMYPIKAKKFMTREEAEKAIPSLPEGVYLIDALYVVLKDDKKS